MLCVLHHSIVDSERTWLCKDILFLLVPSRPFVNPDEPDLSPHCAKMTNTVCPAMPVFYTWPSVFLFPQIFLSSSSKSCIWHGQLYQRWTLLCRHRPATFHHLKITWMSRELLSQAFMLKGSFQKHLDSVILSSCLLSSLYFLHLGLVCIDGEFFGVGSGFLSHVASAAVEPWVWTTCHGNSKEKTVLVKSCPGRTYHVGFKD